MALWRDILTIIDNWLIDLMDFWNRRLFWNLRPFFFDVPVSPFSVGSEHLSQNFLRDDDHQKETITMFFTYPDVATPYLFVLKHLFLDTSWLFVTDVIHYWFFE